MILPFSIIVAVDQADGIGLQGRLPWHLSGDMKHFKTITSETQDPCKKNIVIMGRKTWESIPDTFKPLKNRYNVVLSRQGRLDLPEGVWPAKTFADIGPVIDQQIHRDRCENIFVIGGAQIYEQAVQDPHCQRIFLTRVMKTFSCDAFFTSYHHRFIERQRSDTMTEKDLTYYFSEFQRKD